MILKISNRHRRTLARVFREPVAASIAWIDVEKLLIALGARLSEGRGSRVRVVLEDVKAVVHRPHPRKETDRGTVRSIRRLLRSAGIEPES